jgi:hypothetical protein
MTTIIDDVDRHDGRTITATFTIPGGDPTNPTDRRDPTATTATFRTPSGVETAPSLTKDSTGVYHFDAVFDEALSYFARIAGTGAVTAVAIVEIRVKEDPFTT